MKNYTKNSSKILPKIENKNNKTIIYTEFNGEYNIGDILYVCVKDLTGGIQNIFDSFYTQKGYKLLEKKGNKLLIDFPFNTFTNNNITELPFDLCVIGRVYLNNSNINKGKINGSILNEVTVNSNVKGDIELIQTILVSIKDDNSLRLIENIDFNNKYTDSDDILKTEYNTTSKTVNTFYTKNNNGYDISYINMDDAMITLLNCNINAGNFNNCILSGNNNYINNGFLENCDIDNYTINNGYFHNSVLNTSNVWNFGYWYNDINVSNISSYKVLDWLDGVWVNGIFPETTKWYNGVFKSGKFIGEIWMNGEFQSGEFSGSTWENGDFNSGSFTGTWMNGNFYNGQMVDSTWHNGIFHDGTMYSSNENIHYTWNNGKMLNGNLLYINWYDGEVTNGELYRCTWYNGIFNNGNMLECEWIKGIFYDGIIKGNGNNIWYDGKFYKGTMIDMYWKTGIVFNGVFYDVLWESGIWYNGVAVDSKFIIVEWHNGIFNSTQTYYNVVDDVDYFTADGIISGGTWYNGVFNNGLFGGNNIVCNWEKGNFYNGIFNGNTWKGGLFYKGVITLSKFIPERYKVNKEYNAYNTSKIKKTFTTKKKIPKSTTINKVSTRVNLTSTNSSFSK